MKSNKGFTLIELLMLPVFLAIVALVIFVLVCMAYGLYLSFSASVLLFVVVLLVEPAPFVIGFVYLLGGVNLAALIMEQVTKFMN